jgi:hypothetical protein
MKKRVWTMLFLAAAALLLAGKALVVQVMQSNLLARPDFLSASVASLQKGTPLELIETAGSWYLVRTPGGVQGYIHQTAVAESKVKLSGIVPGQKGASQEELALAAKGFDEGNEKKLRGSQGYNFTDLEWVMGQDVSRPALAQFMREGKLK